MFEALALFSMIVIGIPITATAIFFLVVLTREIFRCEEPLGEFLFLIWLWLLILGAALACASMIGLMAMELLPMTGDTSP